MKVYTLSVTIQEGSDEFWEELEGKSGADEVAKLVTECLYQVGLYEPDCVVRVMKFEDVT